MMQVMANRLEDDVPAGRSCARGTVRGTVTDATVAMRRGGQSFALALRTLGVRCWSHRGGCDARAGLPFKSRDPRQKVTDLAAKSGDRCGEGLEISSGGGGHRIYSYERGRREYTTIDNGSGSR